MKVLSSEGLASRLDFLRPMEPPKDEQESPWCIPFEYGANGKGTCISVAKAREIAAELRAAVADYDRCQALKAYAEERERGDRLVSQYSEEANAKREAQAEVASLKAKLAKARRKGGGR